MPLPNLRVAREEAQMQIGVRIQKGREIRDMTTRLTFSVRDLESCRNEETKWIEYTKDPLSNLFDNASVADEFDRRGGMVAVGGRGTFAKQVEEFREGMNRYLLRLE